MGGSTIKYDEVRAGMEASIMGPTSAQASPKAASPKLAQSLGTNSPYCIVPITMHRNREEI